jgi:prepilin-type N-terminal cleavage/methylation domain-containing protein
MKRDSQGGHSLIELMIAIAILAAVVAIPGAILSGARQAYDSNTSTTGLDQAGRRALDRAAARLSDSGLLGVVVPSPVVVGDALTSVTFRRMTGLDEGVRVWGPNERIELALEPGELLDGVDNDSDGSVDESRVVWTRDLDEPDRTIVLVSGVSRTTLGEVLGNGVDDDGNGLVDERGFAIVFGLDRVELSLALENRMTDGSVHRQVMTRSVALRN